MPASAWVGAGGSNGSAPGLTIDATDGATGAAGAGGSTTGDEIGDRDGGSGAKPARLGDSGTLLCSSAWCIDAQSASSLISVGFGSANTATGAATGAGVSGAVKRSAAAGMSATGVAAAAPTTSRMDFGTTECEKRDLALAAATGMGLLVTRGGNRVGGILLRGSETTTVPPRSGRKHLLSLLERVLATPRADGSGPVDLAGGLRTVGAMAPRRGLVVVISDFDGDPQEWGTAIGVVALRHSVLCIETTDPRDRELPRAGLIEFMDPATGSVREVNTDSARVRADYAAAATERSELIRSTIRGAGADHLVLSTDGDWVMDLARHVSRRRHRSEVMAGSAPR